jgi:hypothetical protein
MVCRCLQQNAVYGATFMGWGATLFFVGRLAFLRRDPAVMKALLYGLFVWFPLGSLVLGLPGRLVQCRRGPGCPRDIELAVAHRHPSHGQGPALTISSSLSVIPIIVPCMRTREPTVRPWPPSASMLIFEPSIMPEGCAIWPESFLKSTVRLS